MISEKKKRSIEDALYKRALGYKHTEVTEEHTVDKEDGEMKLSKKKITYKNVPPDILAAKLLLNADAAGYGEMTEEELSSEKERLLKLLVAQGEN